MGTQITGEQVSVPVGGSTMGAYLVRPAAHGEHPLVLVTPELWGVTTDIRAVADRVAALGYTAIVPDFYHRADADTEFGIAETPEGRVKVFDLLGRITRDEILADVTAALDYAGPSGK